MVEIVGNLHMHTPYSDGALYHADLARIALEAGLDFLIVTDHNVWVRGVEGYRTSGDGRGRVLMLVGEEVHDQTREPQKNHLLALGADCELATFAQDPQGLVDEVIRCEGVALLAHPFERSGPAVGEGDLGWVNWEVKGAAGFELWNYMSEFKSLLTSLPATLFYSFFPALGIQGPFPETLAHWDRMLSEGKRVSVFGGSDAHGLTFHLGPLGAVIFPYSYLFRAVNTHLLIEEPLIGELETDRKRVLAALASGSGWVAYDLPASTRGFDFWAEAEGARAGMGGGLRLRGGRARLLARLPVRAEVELIRAGAGLVQRARAETLEVEVDQPGAYRVQAWRRYRGSRRGWIFSNPIYIQP